MATQNEGNKIVTNGLYLYGKHERVRKWKRRWKKLSTTVAWRRAGKVLPFCYMNALIQIATDKADIPIVQTNKILIFFSFPQSDNIFVLARDGRTLEDLSLVSLSSSTFDSSNFL